MPRNRGVRHGRSVDIIVLPNVRYGSVPAVECITRPVAAYGHKQPVISVGDMTSYRSADGISRGQATCGGSLLMYNAVSVPHATKRQV